MTKDNSLKNKACFLCGYTRLVDRCHLIPKRVIKGIAGYKRMESYEGKHIVLLCKNCHFLFDFNRLTDEEWDKLRMAFKPLYKEIEALLNSKLVPKDKDMSYDQKVSKQKIVSKWIEKYHYQIGFQRVN